MFHQELQMVGEERCPVTPECVGVQGQHDDVADPEEEVQGARKEAVAIALEEEFHRTSLARVGHRKPGIRVGRDQGDDSRHHEGNRRTSSGELDSKSEDSKYTPANHPPDPDGDSFRKADLPSSRHPDPSHHFQEFNKFYFSL